MISSLKGRIIKKSKSDIIIECSGIGYQVFVSKKLYEKIDNEGEEMFIITYLDVKENSLVLYGFYDEKEREIFKLLCTVSGISSKSAHNILMYVGFEEIIGLITGRKNINAKIPGIGTKKMEIISTTLKDKILKFHSEYSEGLETDTEYSANEKSRLEALTALMNLGYSRVEGEKLIREVLKNFEGENPGTEQLIKKSLELTS